MKQLLVIILCALCIFSIAFADTMLNPFTGKMDFVGASAETNSLETKMTGVLEHEIPLGTSADTATYTALSDCDGATNALTYDTATHAFGCHTITGAAHDAVTLAGRDYLTLATQEITAGYINGDDINWATIDQLVQSLNVNWADIEVLQPMSTLAIELGSVKVGGTSLVQVGVVNWNYGDYIDGNAVNWLTADQLIQSTNVNWANIETLAPINNATVNWADMTDLATGGAVTWANLAEGELPDSSVVKEDINWLSIDNIEDEHINWVAFPTYTDDYYLRATGIGVAFEAIPGGGDVSVGGTPTANYIATWSNSSTIQEGAVKLGTMTDTKYCIYDSASDSIVCASEGGSGGGNFFWVLEPQQAKLPASNPMAIDAGNARWRGLFDDTTAESATWESVLQPFLGTLKAKVYYSMASATSGTVEFEIAIDCFSDGDAADFDTASFGTVDSVTATVPGTAGYIDVLADTSLNGDSCAVGDLIVVQIARDADDETNDTATGDAELRKVIIYAE